MNALYDGLSALGCHLVLVGLADVGMAGENIGGVEGRELIQKVLTVRDVGKTANVSMLEDYNHLHSFIVHKVQVFHYPLIDILR